MAFGLSAGAAALVGAVAAPVIGGMMAGDAAEKGADQMSAAGQQSNAMIAAQQARTEAALRPWVTTGNQANNALAYRLGLGGQYGKGSAVYQRAYDANRAATIAAGADSNDPNYERNLELEVQAAMRGYNGDGTTDPAYGSLLKEFDQTDLDNDLVFQNTYKTALDTGTNALNSRAAAGGSYGSGAALKALTRFGAQTANTYTGDAYSRNMAGKQQTYNFLSRQSAQGQNAAAGVGASGASATKQMAGNINAMGNTQAAGTIGSANALAGGIGDATNAYQWNQLMSKNKPSYQTPGINPYGNDYGAGMNSYLYSNAGSGG